MPATPRTQKAQKPQYKAINIIILTMVVTCLCLVLAVGIHYAAKGLAAYLSNTLKINEFYVGNAVLFIFLLFGSILAILGLIVDGDDRRLRRTFKKYLSMMITENYYDEDHEQDAPAAEDAPKTSAAATSHAASKPVTQTEKRDKSARIQELMKEMEYREGRKNGTLRSFYDNGNLKREVTYIDGKMEGVFRTYYENGKLEQQALYRGGKITGAYRSYYDDGSMHQEKVYTDGKLNGVYKALDERGFLFFEISYKDDKQHGPDKIYDHLGVLQYIDMYEDGVRLRRKTFDEYGNLKYDQKFEDSQDEQSGMTKSIEDRLKERRRANPGQEKPKEKK